MDRWAGKIALVTGASVGIGSRIVKTLAEKGMRVIAVARRVEKLQELAACIKREFKTDIYPMVCDVRKEEDILKVFKWADDKLGGIDVLINNAGVVFHEPIINASTENYRTTIDVNVIAMAICSRELSLSPGMVDTDMLATAGVTLDLKNKIPVLQDQDIADGVIYVLSAPSNVMISELTIIPHKC